MPKNNTKERQTNLYATVGVILAAIIAGIFGLWQGGCNKQDLPVKVNGGDYVAGDKTENNNYFLDKTTGQAPVIVETEKQKNPIGEVVKPEERERQIEITFRLPRNYKGYKKIFVDGSEAKIIDNSMMYPKISLTSKPEENQLITLIMDNDDTCWGKQIFDADKVKNYPSFIIPTCK